MFTIKSKLARTLVLDLSDIPFDQLNNHLRVEPTTDGLLDIKSFKLEMICGHINRWLETESDIQPIEYIMKIYEWHGLVTNVKFKPHQ